MSREAGKGSKQRPTDFQKFSEGWERAFGKHLKKEVCDYQDLVATEDCVIDALNNFEKEKDGKRAQSIC